MSEDSPEVRAMWAPQVKIAGPALEQPSVGDLGDSVSDAPAVDPAAVELRTFPAAARKLAAVKPRRSPFAMPGDASDVGLSQQPADTHVARAVVPASPSRTTWMVVGAIVVIGAAIGTAAVWRQRVGPTPRNLAPAAVADGSATIVSRPAGADVMINGALRGTTPLKLSLPVGVYDLELRSGASKRSLTLTVDAATAVREFVDLAPDGGQGSVEVSTDVAGAHVTIDGAARGVTPLTVTDLSPGTHRIGITNNGTTVFRTVNVTAGAMTAVVASVAPAGATGGWLTIQAPLELQVIEAGDVVGTTSAARLMLPAGHHDLLLSAPAYEFQTSISAQIVAGRTVTVPVSVPNGTLSINAAPWADVTVDGRPVGSTPIGNLSLAVGPHDVVWRHPQLGERRQVVAVGARAPSRASVDLTKAP